MVPFRGAPREPTRPLYHLLIFNLTATIAASAGPRGIAPYIRQHFLDTTFRGLYHVNGFDLALLIPYFIVLILLSQALA